VHGRTKSLFSTMKKLLRLDDLAAGGREREDVHDLLALRVIVEPRGDLLPDEAEAAAAQARSPACDEPKGLGRVGLGMGAQASSFWAFPTSQWMACSLAGCPRACTPRACTCRRASCCRTWSHSGCPAPRQCASTARTSPLQCL